MRQLRLVWSVGSVQMEQKRQACEKEWNRFRYFRSKLLAAYLSLTIEQRLKTHWEPDYNRGQCSPQREIPSVGRWRDDRGTQYGYINLPYYKYHFLLWMHHLTVSHQHVSGQNVGEVVALQDSNEIQNQNEEISNPVGGNADLLSPGLSVWQHVWLVKVWSGSYLLMSLESLDNSIMPPAKISVG